MNGNFVKLTLIGISVYLISTGLSYAAFTAFPQQKQTELPTLSSPSPAPKQKHFGIDPSVPRTEACPINGMLYTKQEKEAWSKRRPLAVMIENHEESRPQSGLYHADVVYEAVAEGGITRFLGIFYCGAAAQNLMLAPVRSARIYYLPWVLEYDALYNHVGGAGKCDDPTVDERAKALCAIDKWKIKDLDQFGLPYKQQDVDGSRYSVCYRNTERLGRPVAWEHTMVCETEGLWKFAAQMRKWTNVDEKGVPWDKDFIPWKFKDDPKEDARGASQVIAYSAWSSMAEKYGVRWEYDRQTNSYKRFTGGLPHKDLEVDEQLSPKVVILQFAKYTPSVDQHAHVLYENIGKGDAIIFQDGKAIKGTWSKPSRNARTRFVDAKGKEIEFTRGQLWIDMLPIGTEVAY